MAETATYIQASKLTASLHGWREPATHAVPEGSKPSDATAICGVRELTTHGGEPFDADSDYSCKRCARKVS